MGRTHLIAAALAGTCLLAAGAAQADTKAGVDAWARGDYPTAIREWEAAATRGDADARFNLGQAYKLGRGVQQDLPRAEAYYAQAAAAGHLQAADNYGLLLFQRGEREKALPYLRAGADRGDPRAQYLLGIAHFNGGLVPKDWVRAYALVSLANQQNLPQAREALAQMDRHVPLDQRQQAVALAAELDAQAQATRARQLAAVDLGNSVAAPVPALPARPTPQPVPTVTAARDAAAAADAARSAPRSAGADYARPAVSPAPRPAPAAAAPPAPAPAGTWRVQLGAFGVTANADALWAKVRGRAELAGHPRIDARTGAVTRLQAGGFATRAAAQAACARLGAAGFTCVVTAR